MDNTFVIRQGDQYAIPFHVTVGGSAVTPDNCDDVRIQIGRQLKSYQANGLTYNAENQTWLFPVSESSTALMRTSIEYQVGVKVGSQIVYSAAGAIRIADNIIKEAWNK